MASTGLVAHEPLVRATPAPAALPRERLLQVEVVDARGEPARGVSLACGVVSPSAPELFVARLRTRTDANGSACFELPELDPAAARPGELASDPLRLRAEILAQPAPELVLDPGRLEERVVLRLPPTGSVRLQVTDSPTDSHAGPTATPVRFGVWARAEGSTRDLEPLPRWIEAPDGVALLEHVGLGIELRVAASSGEERSPASRITAPGPRFQGDERTVLVPLGARWPVVLVRALDEHGDALRNELLEVEVRWDRPAGRRSWAPGTSRPRRVRTDDEGRARIPLPGTIAGGYARRLVLSRGAAGTSGGESGILRSAERDLSREIAAGAEIDLGDVVLAPAEQERGSVAWVSGTVTDDGGRAVQDATVLVSAVDAQGARLRRPSAQVEVEANGRFAVSGPPVDGRLAVRAVAPGRVPSSEAVVVPGTRDLSIPVRAAARWTGRLRLDPDVPPESLVVEVITPERKLRTIPSSEHVVIDGLEPGWVDVEVRTRTGGWLVERLEQMATSPAGPPGEQPTDEIELDLRGRLTHLRLRLAAPDGTALDRVRTQVQLLPWPAGEAWILAGRLDLVVPSAAGSITLLPSGHAPVSPEPRGGIQELACAPEP